MYFYMAMVGFEPTPTSTAAPSNTETTVIPSRPLHIYECFPFSKCAQKAFLPGLQRKNILFDVLNLN